MLMFMFKRTPGPSRILAITPKLQKFVFALKIKLFVSYVSYKHTIYFLVLVKEHIMFDVPLERLDSLEIFQKYEIRIRIGTSVYICAQ